MSAAAGNDADSLVVELYAPLYRFAFSLCGSQAPASDLTQETFYRYLTSGGAIRDPSKVKGWLFTTLYREFLRSYRRNARFPHLEIEEVESDLPQVEASDMEQIDGQLAMDALQEVDEVYRGPLSLFYLESLSYTEIAATLEIPVGTVMSRLSRGRSHLRQILKNRLPAEDRKVIPLGNRTSGRS